MRVLHGLAGPSVRRRPSNPLLCSEVAFAKAGLGCPSAGGQRTNGRSPPCCDRAHSQASPRSAQRSERHRHASNNIQYCGGIEWHAGYAGQSRPRSGRVQAAAGQVAGSVRRRVAKRQGKSGVRFTVAQAELLWHQGSAGVVCQAEHSFVAAWPNPSIERDVHKRASPTCGRPSCQTLGASNAHRVAFQG